MPSLIYTVMFTMFVVPPVWYTCVKERRRYCEGDLVSVQGLLYDMEIVEQEYFYLVKRTSLKVNLQCFFNGQTEPIERIFDNITACPSEDYISWIDRLCLTSRDWEHILDEEVAAPSAGTVFVYPGSTAFLFDSQASYKTSHIMSADNLKWIHPASDPYVMLKPYPQIGGYVFERIDSLVARKLSPPQTGLSFIDVLTHARNHAITVLTDYHQGVLGERLRADVCLFDRQYMFVSTKFLVDGDELGSDNPIVEFRHLDCPVCLDPMEQMNEAVLACGHVYHETCIRNWLERSPKCPHCSSRAHIVIVKKTKIN